MNTKIAIKSDSITPFGGIFYAMDEFRRLDLDSLIDNSLGLRSSFIGYQYSEIISSLFGIYYCGGDHIEDIGKHLGGHLELRPGTKIPSPDTLLRGIKELSESDIEYTSEHGSKYAFNKGERLNDLMLDMLLQTSQLKKGTLYDLDFDHQFISTEKYDTRYSYKKVAAVFSDLESGSRVKRFIFRFITVPAKWIKSGRSWVLKLYSDKPYKRLWSS